VCHLRQWLDGYAKDPQSEHLTAVRLAEQALALGGADPGVLANVALVLAGLRRFDLAFDNFHGASD
jgi:Flp pilus assembly protein TadD